MWSSLVFCLIVGFALGSNTSPWKDNKEYIYKIQGRALAGLEIANEFSGILLKATLRIQTRPDGKLQGLIVNPQYAQIHSELSDGWMTYIPDHELNWNPLEMTRKPFQIELNHGVITDIIVNSGVSNWEANILKGMISQFQLHLNEADSHMSRNDNHQDSALYNVYEETVSGNTLTMYEVNPIPKHMLLNSEVPEFYKLEEDGDQMMEVVKQKNYTDNIELPSYFYGFGNTQDAQAATNAMGKFFLRNTVTRVLINGNLNQFTIQHAYTINEIVIHPTLGDDQSGAVYTSWNTTLQQVKSQEQIIAELASPVRLGCLTYTYDKPYAKSNQVKERISERDQMRYNSPAFQRLNPSLLSKYENSHYKQDQPQMSDAPETPFLPYAVGNKGLSIKSGIDIVSSAIKIAKELGEDLQDPRKTLHENAFDKFITLTWLIRMMDESELRQVSKELYTTSKDHSEYAAWTVFRDAVAVSGHGPALLLIESWIDVKYIQHEEASHIISTVADSVRLPTAQYMKKFFELIKKPIVVSTWPLNETAVLSFSDLVRRVYFQPNYFDTQFPVKSFENLKDKDSLSFVRDDVIPYLTQCLEKAILKADTNKIHTYIRALGFIGTPEILKAFEPYLEGKKQCSQFQRTLMIVSMDRLVKTAPHVARSILFRAYQNTGETSAVRVAAVFQLVRTDPPVDMLQFMASYTKIDMDEQVNAVVKTSIQRAAKLVGGEFEKLQYAAEMAEPLLTDKEYGIDQGANFLKTYFSEHLNVFYKETVQIMGSQFWPSGMKYALRTDVRGIRHQIVNVQSLFSRIDELSLFNATKEQIAEREQKQNSEGSQKYKYSSQNIAKILNMKSEVLEQLEGSIFFMALNTPYKMISFDNRTLQYASKSLWKWEEELRNGKDVDYIKFLNGDQMTLAVPNEMGLPFIFTYNAPIFVKLQGRIQAASKPKLIQNGKVHLPENVQAKLEVSLTVGNKMTGHISFVTPFDNQQYISGYEKVMQVNVPLFSNIEVDIRNQKVQIEVEPKEIHPKAHLLHYSTWPFTARKNIMDLSTLSAQQNKHIIKPESLRRVDRVFGKKEMGIALQVELEHDRNTMQMSDIRTFCNHGFIQGFKNIWNDNQIQYSHLNVTYLPEQSWTKQIVLRLGHKKEYKKESKDNSFSWHEVSDADKPSSRQQMLMKGVSMGIKNVETHSVDATIQFEGQENIEYVLSGAYARSNVDAKSRVLAIFKKDQQNGKPFEMTFNSVNDIPNTNSMDLQDILRSEPKARSSMELTVTKGGQSKVKADIKFTRSDSRKEYLKQQSMYKQCARDERAGNKQSPVCVTMVTEANLLDKVDVDVKYDQINPALRDVLETAFAHIQYANFPNIEYKKESSSPEQQMKVQVRFDHDLRYINVSVNTHEKEVIFKDIELNEYAKRILVVHPNVPIYTRALSKALEIDNFRRTCVVDRTQVTTFNNFTYPADVSRPWTVVAQYVPKLKSVVEEQLRQQRKNYVILVRQSENKDEKDVKIVLSTPKTSFKVVDITLTPNQQDSSQKAIVKVNDKQVQIRDSESHDIEDGHVQIYTLPNGETKVIVKGKFYVVYDGKRAKVVTLSHFLKDRTRGLCGQFNGQQNEDFLTPQNCYARNPQKFVRSYEVEGSEGKQERNQLERDADECLEKHMPVYINMIREQDVNTIDFSDNIEGNSCTRYVTKYVEQGQDICFTTHIVPSCRNHCQAQGYITKNIPVHCMSNKDLAQIWKMQIDNGASPDFSQKSETRTAQMEIPQSCIA